MIDAKLEQRIRLLHGRSGLSYEAIAARLSSEGVPASASGHWNWSTIRRVANRGPLREETGCRRSRDPLARRGVDACSIERGCHDRNPGRGTDLTYVLTETVRA